jgi:general secretion pathway protein K
MCVMIPRRNPRCARERGFIIVAVLWMLLALSALASIYAAYVVRAAYAIGPADERVNAEALFKAALELTAYRLTAVEKQFRPASGRLNFRMGRATVGVEFHSEGARIDVNAAPKALLSNFFIALGAKPDDAQGYADRVIAWRSPASDNAGSDPEADVYRAAGRNYRPRRAPFQDIGELWLVAGLPPGLVERALPYLTVYSGQPSINIMDASPLVLSALPEIAPEQINAVLAMRQSPGATGPAVMTALGGATNGVTFEPSRAIRVSVAVRFESGTITTAEIVMLLTDDGNEPYRILSWRDDFDQIAPAGG